VIGYAVQVMKLATGMPPSVKRIVSFFAPRLALRRVWLNGEARSSEAQGHTQACAQGGHAEDAPPV
jgi:hypothetical protein